MYKKIIIPILGMALLFSLAMAFISSSKIDKDEIKSNNGTYEPIVVLELFTSQGCSSCPPADKLLQKAKKEYPDKVFALSYHVDYWNYIGWEDPFSKSQFTTKQTFYNRKLGYRGNYTPETVVNGREHFVGSSAAKMNSKIAAYGKTKAQNKIDLKNLMRSKNELTFDFKVEGALEGKVLRAVLVLDERTTSVKRGENRNRTLTNSNIVVLEKYLEGKGGTGSATLQIPGLVGANENITLMLLVETENLDIVGAIKSRV